MGIIQALGAGIDRLILATLAWAAITIVASVAVTNAVLAIKDRRDHHAVWH